MGKNKYNNILLTGGCGFIGTNFIKYIFNQPDFEGKIINIDALTYSGNKANLEDIYEAYGREKYFFYKVDICDKLEIDKVFEKHNIDCIIHFAAESHVDRSITGPSQFIKTNVVGTHNLLEVARKHWIKKDFNSKRFHHISTDEVYGSLGNEGYFYEDTCYNPRSPYSASKASSDHLVRSYYHTFGLPVTVSNCSNNYGPYQHPEKLIPLMITKMLNEERLPVYGKGENIRDWLYVEDHCSAVWEIVHGGRVGETYNVGGDNELKNIDLVYLLCETVAKYNDKNPDYYKKLISFVKDRLGHDYRYAINCDKIKRELKWIQKVDFKKGLDMTVNWYINNSK